VYVAGATGLADEVELTWDNLQENEGIAVCRQKYGSRWAEAAGRGRGTVDSPDSIADIIRHQNSAMTKGDPNRPTTRLSIGIQEVSQDVDRHTSRTPLNEANKDHTITTQRASVPGTVLTNKSTGGEWGWKTTIGGDRQP